MPNFSAWGINENYRDDYGQWRTVSEKTKATFLAAMEATSDGPPRSRIDDRAPGRSAPHPGILRGTS